jgi:membrane protein
VVGVVGDELIQRIGTWFPIRVVRRYLAVSGYDRALALACQAFVALVPMLIVVAATLSERGRVVANGYVVDGLHLSGSAAADLQALVQRPPEATEPITLVGVALLVLSVFGFTRTLQRTCQAAWDLPTQGLRGFALGLLGAAALVAEVVVTVLVGRLLMDVANAVVIVYVVRLILAVLLWWPVQWLLLGGRVRWRHLFPGSVVLGAGQVVVTAVSGVYLQWAIQDQAHRYGLIGVSFVLVSWLIVLGLLLVVGAVVSAEMAHDPPRLRRSAPVSPEPSDGR